MTTTGHRSIAAIEADLKDATERGKRIIGEVDALAERNNLTPGETVRFDNLRTGAQRAQEEIFELEVELRAARVQKVREVSAKGLREGGDGARIDDLPRFNRNVDPFAPVGHRETPQEARSRAISAVETWNADDAIKQAATLGLERAGSGADVVAAAADAFAHAEHILRFGSPTYISAFRKFSRDPEGGYVADFTPEEAAAWREARHHTRTALQISGSVLPAPLDPTVVLTTDGVTDPMRQVARLDTTTAATKRYVTSAGSTFSWDGEIAEVSDDTPALTEVELTTRKAQGWIEASIEAAMDQPMFEQEVVKIIYDGKSLLEASAYVNGTQGSNEPNGIVTQLAGTASEINVGTSETFSSADVYALIEALPPRFRQNATWMAELSTINAIDQFETSNGAKLFPDVGGNDPRLLRRRLVENSAMDAYSDVNTAANGNNYILLVGDFSNAVILDRVGMTISYVPPGHIVNTNANRPDGRVGWYCYWRTTSGILTANAFRLLDLPTTA